MGLYLVVKGDLAEIIFESMDCWGISDVSDWGSNMKSGREGGEGGWVC